MKKLLSTITLLFIGSIAFSQTTLTSTVSNVSCFGGSNGSASVTAIGGTAPYTYTWTPTNTHFDVITGLAAGSYTVYVEDAVANTSSLVVNIGEPTQLTAVTTVTHTNCGQANGATCATISGGMGATTYSWSNGVTTLCNSGIVAGGYTLSVTDANGCTTNAYSLIGDYAGPVVSISSQTNISCFGLCNGSANSSVAGGALPYIYSWMNGAMTPSVTNLCAGLYNLTVTDAMGCVGTASVVITQPPPLNANVNASNVKCFGTATGTVAASTTGGIPPYNYLWTGISSTLAVNPNVVAGNYQVNVTDANGCNTNGNVIVTQPSPLTVFGNAYNASCGNTCDGSLFGMANGGTSPYVYSWGFPQLSQVVQGVCPGSYTLMVLDVNSCAASSTATVNSTGTGTLSGVTTTLTNYNETCLYSGDGAIDLSIGGSNPGPFTYQWNTGATTQDLTNLTSNYYSVTVFDAAMNCMTYWDSISSIGVNCGSISGNAYIDNNTDCIKNSGDNNWINGFVIANPGNRYGYTNSAGDYIISNLPYGTYSLSIGNTYGGIITTCTTTISAMINSGQPNSFNNNLSVGFNSTTQPDLKVYSWSGGIVPGFVCGMSYTLLNQNNVNGSGIFKAVLPSAFIPNITMVTPATYTLSGDTVMWNFSNLNYSTNYSTSFNIQFTVPLSTPLGSIFTSCAYAQPTIADYNQSDNTYCYSRMVTGAYDPNDKTPNPVGVGATGDIAASVTDLTYLIRFQNTGNGPAVNIKVTDTLSSNVNVSTFEMLGASHNYDVEILPGNVLRWKFNNIMLVDSGTNEPASHGYIQYRIKRTTNNTPGTQIKNTANIYFDFNEPVITNTAINTIETITGIHSQSANDNGWEVYPNPSNGILYIVNSSMVKEAGQIQVLNSVGQSVLEENINGNYKNIDLSKLNNGVYFVKITSDKNTSVKRVVLSK
ncbi:MAG: hypothetical protein K0S53_1522 [Bacteroidetes bacterium]|jgi:hypothetical protein|nr:hypothetical protein [Bacteroidota bacterium]